MSYQKLIIFLLILSLILILTGCLGKLIPATPEVTSSVGTEG
jgi:PBP1b-binding outer membrane lipoprotein LpoB